VIGVLIWVIMNGEVDRYISDRSEEIADRQSKEEGDGK